MNLARFDVCSKPMARHCRRVQRSGGLIRRSWHKLSVKFIYGSSPRNGKTENGVDVRNRFSLTSQFTDNLGLPFLQVVGHDSRLSPTSAEAFQRPSDDDTDADCGIPDQLSGSNDKAFASTTMAFRQHRLCCRSAIEMNVAKLDQGRRGRSQDHWQTGTL